MGSPAIFSGKFTKLLTQKGIMNSDGSLNQFDGVKNYLTYNNFENNAVTGWSKFNTTMTSGLPTGSITSGSAAITTFATTSTNPISGSYSLQAASSGVWTAGHGFISDVMTLEREDLAKPLTVEFSYSCVANPTNANWSGQLGSQTFGVYIYDVTNSTWLQPSGFLGLNQAYGVGTIDCSFQSSNTAGQQYRIAIIALQASSGAITINFDNFKLSNIQPSIGYPVTDYIDYTPTCNWTTGYTITGKYRRVGDALECIVKLTCTGAPLSASETTFSIPPGFAIDTDKLLSPAQGAAPTYGDAVGRDISTTNLYLFRCQYWTSTTVKLFYQSSSTGQETAVTTSLPPSWSTNDTIIARFTVPVVGISSSVQMSNSTDTRIVACEIQGSTISIPNSTDTLVTTYSTRLIDTHSAFNLTTGLYTVPVSGFYNVAGILSYNTNTSGIRATAIRKNGTIEVQGTTTNGTVSGSNTVTSVCAVISCNAGDTIGLNAYQTSGGSLALTGGKFVTLSIHRISGPSAIAASETLAAFGQTTAGLSIPNSTWTTVTTPTIVDSTHGSLTTGGVFTAPISGRYFVSGIVSFSSNASGYRGIRIRKNSGDTGIGTLSPPVSGDFSSCTCSGYLKLNAGDTVIMQAVQTSGGALTLVTSTILNSNISIIRVGN